MIVKAAKTFTSRPVMPEELPKRPIPLPYPLNERKATTAKKRPAGTAGPCPLRHIECIVIWEGNYTPDTSISAGNYNFFKDC
jgi:hypothetical protein